MRKNKIKILQRIELERAILGACLVDSTAFSKISDVLKSEQDFYDLRNAELFSIMKSLHAKIFPIDLLTVSNEIIKMPNTKIGFDYLSEITDRVASAANIEAHARLVKESAMRRDMLTKCDQLALIACDEATDIADVVEAFEKASFSITANLSRGVNHSMFGAATEYLERLDMLRQKTGITGIPTGFFEVDNMTGGWQNSDLIILAARPGMGKTSFALSMAKKMAEQGIGVGIFSLEMSLLQLFNRLASMEAEISTQAASRPAKLDEDQFLKLCQAAQKVAELPIQINDIGGMSLSEVCSHARQMVASGAKIIIIDYLQLMNESSDKSSGNREQEISRISRGIKALAKELDIPIIALSQLSRAVETRGGEKRPQLSDLRESGSIEQDADIVTFLYRPEYYKIVVNEDGESLKGVAELIFSKHRNGPLGEILLNFKAHSTEFTSFTDQYADFVAKGQYI